MIFFFKEGGNSSLFPWFPTLDPSPFLGLNLLKQNVSGAKYIYYHCSGQIKSYLPRGLTSTRLESSSSLSQSLFNAQV